MLDKFKKFPDEIIFREHGPCVSLYQRIHRHAKVNSQDVVFFNNTIKDIEKQLKERYKDVDAEKIIKSFETLREDKEFWTMPMEGIAILADEDRFLVYLLQEPVENLLKVEEAFHILPLLKVFQSSVMYNLLGIQGNDFKVYQGSKYDFEELDIGDGVPRTIDEVLGAEHTEKFLNHGSFSGSAGSATFHGQGSKKDELEEDIKKYFRYIDKLVAENFSKEGKLPLILVGLKENQGLFRKFSNNSQLLDEGIQSSYKEIDKDTLVTKAWAILEKRIKEDYKSLVEEFGQAEAKGLGSDNLHKIKKAIMDKRIKIMMVEADREISPELDGLVKLVLKEKGQILVLEKEEMPSDTGVAAIYRF